MLENMSRLGMTATLLLLFAGFASAHMIATTSSISFSPSGSVVEGTNVTINGHVEVTGAQHPNPTPPWNGTLRIEMCTNGNGSGAPAANCSNASLANWTLYAIGTPDGFGNFSAVFETAGLGGSVIGFRAHYVTEGGSHKPGTSISPAMDLVVTEPSCSGVMVSADLASGNGTPAPGDAGPWTFRIKVEACEAVSGVFAQGGTNGWAPMVSAVPSVGAYTIRYNKRNQVLRWLIGDLTAGQMETILVTVDGNVPASAACNSVRYLSGAWSATYSTDGGATYNKSDYSGRVSVSVTC